MCFEQILMNVSQSCVKHDTKNAFNSSKVMFQEHWLCVSSTYLWIFAALWKKTPCEQTLEAQNSRGNTCKPENRQNRGKKFFKWPPMTEEAMRVHMNAKKANPISRTPVSYNHTDWKQKIKILKQCLTPLYMASYRGGVCQLSHILERCVP